MVDVLAAEMFCLNVQLCTAFSELGMWELVEPIVSDALELAEMSGRHFYVSQQTREWLVDMRATTEEQMEINNRDTSATQA